MDSGYDNVRRRLKLIANHVGERVAPAVEFQSWGWTPGVGLGLGFTGWVLAAGGRAICLRAGAGEELLQVWRAVRLANRIDF